MSTLTKKIIFYGTWILLVSLGPISIIKNTPLNTLSHSPALLVNFFQRIVGLVAFTILFIQIILGSFMSKWTEKLGGWIFSFHILEGILVYFLILAHPIFFMVYRYLIGQGFDPFFIFTSLCILCHTKLDLYYTFGRIAFWFISISVFAGYFRVSTPFLRTHWRKFHVLNYFSFLLIGLHSILLGTDIGSAPFSYFHGPSLVIISGILLYKGYLLTKK